MRCRIQTIFTIKGFDVDGVVPSTVTRITGINPTDTWIKGEVRRFQSFHSRESGWEYQPPIRDTNMMEHDAAREEIESVWNAVRIGVKRLREEQAAERYQPWSINLSLHIYPSMGSAGTWFKPDFMRDLSDHKVMLGVNVYAKSSPDEPQRPKVGVTAMLTHNRRLLVGRRKGSHGAGMFAFPGGHQEWWKTWGETAIDEVLQETGLHAEPAPSPTGEEYLFVTDNHMAADNRHYTTVWVPCIPTGDSKDINTDAVVQGREPEKCEQWYWLSLDEVIRQILDKEDYTWHDIESQSPAQADWLPIKRLLLNAQVLGLDWPQRLAKVMGT